MTVRDAVERERRRVLRSGLTTWVAGLAAATLVLLTAGVALLGDARWLTLPRGMPFAIWGLVFAVAAAGTWRVVRDARATTPGRIAARIETEQGLRSGVVRGALEVADHGALGRRAADEVARDLGGRGPVLAPALRRTGSRRAGIAVGAAALAAAAALLVAPAFGDGVLAILHPSRAYAGALLPRLALRDLPTDLLRDEPLRVTVAAPSRSHVTVHYRAAGDEWRRVAVPVHDGVGSVALGPMRRAMQVVATDGRSVSDTASIALAERPFIGAVTMRAAYPAYLGRAGEALPVGGRVAVPRGTILTLSGRSSVALQRVALVAGTDTVALHTAGHAFDGRFEVGRSAVWHWQVGAAARTVDVPEPMAIDVLPDSLPVAHIEAPAADTAVAPGEAIAVGISAVDDHGLAAVLIETRVMRGSAGRPAVERTVAARTGPVWEGTASVNPGTIGAEAGDVVHVRATAVDASPWSQRGSSRVLRIRLLNAGERRERARDLGDSAVAAAVAAARSQRALTQRTETAARTRDRTSSRDGARAGAEAMSSEAGEQARTIAREQRQLVEKVEAMRDAADRLQKGLEQAGAMDSSLARQLREAQDLMRQALTPELMAQMQRLEQAAQRLDGTEARQALSDLAGMQRRLREQLERSAEMLKRAAHEGAMQTLSDEARELAARERSLADSAAGGKPDAAREANALADRSRRYADEVQRLQKQLAEDRATAAASGTSAARDAAARAEEQLRAGAMGDAKQDVAQGSRGAAQQMDRAAQAMQEARDAQVKEWKQELTGELDRAVQETLQMAREERALEEQAREGKSGPEQMRGRQSSVQQGVDRTGQRLQEAGRRSALLSGGAQRAMAEARQKVEAATRELTKGTGAGSDGVQDSRARADALAEAAEALNRAAASLARDRQRAGSASSASGFAEMMQQLQEMAKQQGSINAQAQSLMQMPGGQQSPQGAQMARALARRQRQVAQGLDDVSAEAGGGRTGALAREARQLADALDAGRLDPRTAARQEQLFRRLLDAGRSLEKEEREDTDRREARAALDPTLHTPAATDATGADARRFREPTWEELRGLSAEERRAILEYFRRINAPGAP